MPTPDDRTVPPLSDRTAAAPVTAGAARTVHTEVQAYQPHFPAPGMPAVPGYVVSREVGRGGMGAVYAALDPAFQRDVAVKVMHPGQDAGRFVVESRVTARLPHPGVPPVHALGTLPDGRPFLVMKLVRGRTLSAAIDDATDEDLPDLLAAFERVCETVGFAHSNGVIHRDLKPQNVMVGQFGEVLVMDWGLAKELRTPEELRIADCGLRIKDHSTGARETPNLSSNPQSAIRNPQSKDPQSADATRLGEIKGTPAYMSPEQARGEPVDARTDVFALGGILAAILTGVPPFYGRTAMDTVLKAARAELDDCFARLDECAYDPELVALARKCLAADPAERFASGVELADAVADYRAGVEERLQRAERERAVAAAEAREQRKRRRVQGLLAGVLALLVALAGGVAVWRVNARAERARKAERELAERQAQAEQAGRTARDAIDLGVALRRQLRFAEAERALEQGRAAANAAGGDLVRQLDRARADAQFAGELDAIRYRKREWVAGPGLDAPSGFDVSAAPARYEAAFAVRGLPLRTIDPAAAARTVAASAVSRELVAALDDWALFEPDPAFRARLLQVARKADPDPWRDEFRDPAAWADPAALARLAAAAKPETAPPAVTAAFATVLGSAGLNPAPLLTAARAAHPDDFGLAFALGLWYAGRGDQVRAIGPYEAARALRPDNASARNNLGVAYYFTGEYAAAAAVFREIVRRDPTSTSALNNLGGALHGMNDFAGAAAAYRDLVKLLPDDGLAYSHLGTALAEGGQFDEGIAANLRAVELSPRSVRCRTNLAVAYRLKGDYQRALVVYREVLALDPTDVFARNSFGVLWRDAGHYEAAIQEFKAALRLNPANAGTLNNLGNVYDRAGRPEVAVAPLLESIRLAPNVPDAHLHLGNALHHSGDLDGAVRAFQTVIQLAPNYARPYTNLGSIYRQRGNLAAAVAAHTRAVTLAPDFAIGHYNLGQTLRDTGDPDGALAAYRKATNDRQTATLALYQIGTILEERSDMPGAAGAFEDAVRADERNYFAHAALARLYGRLEKYDAAVASAERAVALAPAYADGYGELGLVRQRMGDIVGARAALLVAARLDGEKWTAPLVGLSRPLAPPPRPVEP
jgi:tetratricopeptide (TPR) repeat protein